MLFISDGDRHSGISKKEFFASWTGADGPPPPLWCDMIAGISSPPDSLHEHVCIPSPRSKRSPGELFRSITGARPGKLEAGDVIFLAAGEYNRLNCGEDGCSKICRRYRIRTRKSGAFDVRRTHPLPSPAGDLPEGSGDHRTADTAAERKEIRPGRFAEVFRLMMELSLSKPDNTPAELSEARNFLNAKLAGKHVLPELAKYLHLTASGLNKLFRNNFQTTPAVFLLSGSGWKKRQTC